MAISFVGAADLGNNGGSGNLSVSYTCGSGSNRLLVIAVRGDSGDIDNIVSVTYNGVSCTDAVSLSPAPDGGGARYAHLYYLLNPDSGSNTLLITPTSNYIIAGAADYAGVLQSGQPDAIASLRGGPSISTLSKSITTVASGSWAVMNWGGYDANNPPTAGAGSTRRTFDATFGAWGLFDSGSLISPAGAYSMTGNYTNAVDGISLVMASFAPDGVGGSGVGSGLTEGRMLDRLALAT